MGHSNRVRAIAALLIFAVIAMNGAVLAQSVALPPTRPADHLLRRPHVVLVMADDQGWGETSYNGHPLLRTPNLDAMAENGLRFHRFYAGGPVCSPTRAAVLTGRVPDRAGVKSHGYALRHQETTLPALLKTVGYQTAHFGKWHLNGLKGPGVPILAEDTHHPGNFGFDTWLSTSNYFDRDPLLSRGGEFEEFRGDSSEIVVEQALEYMQAADRNEPMFVVIWFGSPHSPFVATDADREPFAALDDTSANHYAEIVALDRAVGTLRQGLRELDMAENTLLWYCSDNGGLPKIEPETVGGLRGNKGNLYEGGIRVPGIIEWPSVIPPGVVTEPASVLDILPTVLELAEVPLSAANQPLDGESLLQVLRGDPWIRQSFIPFHYQAQTAIIDRDWKLLKRKKPDEHFELYNLTEDPAERHSQMTARPEVFSRLFKQLTLFEASLDKSIAGEDYPLGRVAADHPQPQFWYDVPAYQSQLEEWGERPEYRNFINR